MSDLLPLLPTLGIGAILGTAVCLFFVMRPVYGLYVLTATVLLIERYPFHGSLTAWPQAYDNLNVTLGVPGLFINPVEIMIGLVAIGWLIRKAARPDEKLYIQTVSILAVLYGGWMVFSVGWGFINGGNWKVALWILRPVVYLLTVSFLGFQLLRDKRHCRNLLWLTIICVTIKSAQIIFRKFTIDAELQAYGEHEETSFALYVAWMTLAAFFMPFPAKLRRALLIVSPVIILAIIFNDRRINLATGILGGAGILVMQSRETLKKYRGVLIAAACLGMLYLVAGWFGPTTPITAPVKGFKEGVRAEVFGDNTDHSSWYRKVERYNLRHTVRANPAFGTGLGVKYLQLIGLDQLSFEYFVYITHNQVLLVHSATGTVGFFLFLVFYVSLVTQNTIYFRFLRGGWERATALMALLSVMNWLVVAYYDMQLFFYRNSIAVAIFIAIPAALYRVQLQEQGTRE